MIVLEYEVYDLLSASAIVSVLSGEIPVSVKVYARKGEEGLLEDYLTEKKFTFFAPQEVEVDDGFTNFCVTTLDKIKEIDLANDSGRLILKSKPLEPSVN